MNENIFETFDRGTLLRSAHKYANNDDDSEDYTQQALLNAWERRADINSLPEFLKMSIHAAYKQTIKELRCQIHYIELHRAKQHSNDAAYDLQLEAFSEKADRLIKQLPPMYRKTFKYRLLNYSIEKIAKTMRVKEGTVMSRLYYVRKKLQEELSEYSDLVE